mgnify:CR=1 FL=1
MHQLGEPPTDGEAEPRPTVFPGGGTIHLAERLEQPIHPLPGNADAGISHGEMQHRLFAELSTMFGKEVPLYDKALLVNKECNKAVCALLGQMYTGFTISDEQLDKTSGERHGAIRIGRPDEYRWIARFFAQFANLLSRCSYL